MSYEALQALEALAADDPGPLERARLQSAAADRAEEAAAVREKAEREAERAERTEALAILNRAAGDPLGQMSVARAVIAAADDEIAELSAKLARAEAKRSRAADSMKFYAERLGAAQDCVQRSAGGDLLAPAKAQLKAHQEYVQASRAAWSAAQAGAPRARRPFAGRGGEARRSESCQHCIDQGVDDETSFLLHSDPQLAVPVTPPQQAEQPVQAKRRTPMIYAGTEISR